MKARDVLLQAAANLRFGATGWCQGAYAKRPAEGVGLVDTWPLDERATCRCAVGACGQVAGLQGYATRKTLDALGLKSHEIVHYNDHVATTADEVAEFLEQRAAWPEADKEIE